MSSSDDFLLGGGVKSAKFDTPGTKVSGVIVRDPQLMQQREYGTGKPLTWEDGTPREQLRVCVATSQHEAGNDADDGERAVYLKGNLLKAVREACRRARAPGLRPGGTLTITYTGDDPDSQGFVPAKLYAAEYVPPELAAATADVEDDEPPF